MVATSGPSCQQHQFQQPTSGTFTQAQTVPHQQQGLGTAAVSGPSSINQPVAIEGPDQTPRRTLPPTLSSASSPSINHFRTSPLAAFIPSLANSAAPSPLPFLPLLPPQITSLRANLTRRRSSFPPSNIPASTASSSAYPWVVGGTPTAELNARDDVFPGFDSELTTGMAWTPGAGWEGLLDFDFDKPAAPIAGSSTPNRIFTNGAAVDAPLLRGKNEPGLGGGANGASAASLDLPLPTSPSKIAQFGSDLAWRTILGSVIEVEGVGEVGVARVLQEVWKRGGGDVVSPQSLWPSILIALSLPLDSLSPGVRISTPSIQASMALQNLYNLTLRSWEPAIFSGLLASFVAANPGKPPVSLPLPPQSNLVAGSTSAPDDLLGGMTPVYGSSTPTKELDLSHWMNVTPGADWSMLGLGVGAGAGQGATSPKSLAVTGVAGPGPSSLAFEIGEEASREQHRRSSTSRTDEGDSTKGIDDLIAAMEEGREAHERQLVAQAAAMSSLQVVASTSLAGKAVTRMASDATATHLPTPETDSSESPGMVPAHPRSIGSSGSSRKGSFQLTPPESAPSPATPATSNGSSTFTFTASKKAPKQPVAASQTTPQTGHAKPAMQLALPEASFVPPPPMCMFFSPNFHDLQNGKVGVWKGDLEIKGRGGGKFSVLIVGEEATGYLWQSQTWPSTITYPSLPTPTESYTATMIPVSHLAREGFTPAAMGMVLCNDANISQYVSMVQGLHAEGVAFHLPSVSKLPIVFLPAKFNSADPLQRLGIAFMTKPGFPLPPRPPANLGTASVATATAAAAALAGSNEAASVGAGARAPAGPKKRRRRQSAPSKSTALGSSLDPAPGSGSGSGGTGPKGHKRRGTMQGLCAKGAKIEEEVIMEEEG